MTHIDLVSILNAIHGKDDLIVCAIVQIMCRTDLPQIVTGNDSISLKGHSCLTRFVFFLLTE